MGAGIALQGYSVGDGDSDLPPPPPPIAQQYGHGPYSDGSYPPPPSGTMHGGGYPPPPPHHREQRQPGDGSGAHQPSTYTQDGVDQQWYESGIKSGAESTGAQVRQQNPPELLCLRTLPCSLSNRTPLPYNRLIHTLKHSKWLSPSFRVT